MTKLSDVRLLFSDVQQRNEAFSSQHKSMTNLYASAYTQTGVRKVLASAYRRIRYRKQY